MAELVRAGEMVEDPQQGIRQGRKLSFFLWSHLKIRLCLCEVKFLVLASLSLARNGYDKWR